MDLHKRTDRFIKDAFHTEEGISEYIRRMESAGLSGFSAVGTWNSDYKMLKHIRWVRNQLAHEVGYDSVIQKEGDHEWLQSFYDRLNAAEDPLALLRKQQESKAKPRPKPKQEPKQKPKQKEEQELKILPGVSWEPKRKPSFKERLKRFFGL
ncbi:MAG: hypothetical protein IK088_07600 [Lachnospiraceae bacterium]|nr:hypothetical protein [Lachnospiraceae bacterium]MBR4768824.1 hypothetical protein [Lachnospiraceae bacterium]